MASNNITNVRPRQVLLVGLGGIGSRTVDTILSVMPDAYKPYTKAIAVDTDLEELDKLLKYIPRDNRIALGSNPDSGQSVSVGEYIRNHPKTTDWFVKGEKMELIERRNTAQGAKQIRMVSRIALDATDKFCGMTKKLETILQSLNKADGTSLSRGLLVMVVCSVAGGTGAGTVLQFPLYLEQALSKNFSDEDIQMECAMLLPNIFSRAQDTENQMAARANAYAVIRELMSMNSGRLTRGDMLPGCDFGKKANHVSPYGRVLFFDDVSMAGDSLAPDLDRVHVPKTAKAINEYLFGPVSGKITSALDNTLARVYRTGGASIFSSVGTAKLEFPRATYVQYVLSNWITKVIGSNWSYPDIQANKMYSDALKRAVKNGEKKPTVDTKRKFYCECVDAAAKNTAFFREIQAPFFSVINKKKVDCANEFWTNCRSYLEKQIKENPKVKSAIRRYETQSKAADSAVVKQTLDEIAKAANEAVATATRYGFDVMRPTEAVEPRFYSHNDDSTHLFVFLKKKKLHPIMIRYFLYQLLELAEKEAAKSFENNINYDSIDEQKKMEDRVHASGTIQGQIETRAKNEIVRDFAVYLKNELTRYVDEIDGLFGSLSEVVRVFDEKQKGCVEAIQETSNPKTGTILAGGELSMKYTWQMVEAQTGETEGSYTIDDDLNLKLHELVYRSYYAQTTSGDDSRRSENGVEIKVKTKYNVLIAKELQKYYSVLLKENYTMCFPKNVLEAALLECGLQNRYIDEKSRVDSTTKFGYDEFLSRGPVPLHYKTDQEDVPTELTSNARYVRALLDQAVNNSKPYCGRIDDNVGEKAIINRLCVVNSNLRRTKEDPTNVDEFGVAGVVYIEDELIDGVSTSEIGGKGINTRFEAEGISVDEIVFVTTLAGLQPFNFVAFLPPDDAEHAPTQEKTYYSAYRELISNLTTQSNYITPHLHRNWHLADMLDDLTTEHTDTYNRSAATAFIYGFVFDVIQVVTDGSVMIGKMNNPHFQQVFGESGMKVLNLLDPSVHSSVNNDEETFLTAEELQKKRNVMNSVLVKLLEYLATSQPVREAIISYCEEQMSIAEVQINPVFVLNSTNHENISGISYDCILDVIDGYYHGTRQIVYHEADRGTKNATNMFRFVLESFYNAAKLVASDASTVKTTYEGFVKVLYDSTLCDDAVEDALETVETTLSDETSQESGFVAENKTSIADIMSLVTKAKEKQASVTEKPFGKRGIFSLKNALDMFEIFIKD